MITAIVPFDLYENTKLCLDFCKHLKQDGLLEIVFFNSKDDAVDKESIQDLVKGYSETSIYEAKDNAADELTELTAERLPSIIVHAIGNEHPGARVPNAEIAGKYILQLKQNFILLPQNHQPSTIKRIIFPIHTLSKVRHKVSLTARIAKLCNAEIFVVNVITTSNKKLEQRCIVYGTQVHNHFKSLGIRTEIETIHDKDLSGAVVDYAENKQGDFISLIPESNLGLFSKSFIQEIIKKISIPVLIVAPRKSKLTGSFKTSG